MKSSRVQVQANSQLAALKNNNYLFHLSKSSKLQQLRLKRRPRKISETDLLRRKTPEEIWKESWQDMLWHDGTEPLKSSCSRKITVPVSTCGQLVVFSLNFLEWWKKTPRHLWTDNLFSQERVASPYPQRRTPPSRDKDSPSATRTNLQ